MSPSIQAVIFDIGGVIQRTEDKAPRTELGRRFGLTYAEIDRLVFGCEASRRASVGQATEAELWEAVRQALGAEPGEMPDVIAQFWAGDQIDTELMDYIRGLRPRYTTAVLSNAWPGLRKVLTETFPIADAFDLIMISGEEGLAKPDPRLFQRLLERLELPAEATVFVDDFIENIEAARSLGMQAVHFRSRQQALRELDALLKD